MNMTERAGWTGFAIGSILAATLTVTVSNLTADPTASACHEDEVAVHDTTATDGDYTGTEFNTVCMPLDNLTEPTGTVAVHPAYCTDGDDGYLICTVDPYADGSEQR
jgi:hypothetical protein